CKSAWVRACSWAGVNLVRSPGLLPGLPERRPGVPCACWRRPVADRVAPDAEDPHGFVWAHTVVDRAASPASAVLLAGRVRACACPCAGHRHRSCTCNTTGTNRFQLNNWPVSARLGNQWSARLMSMTPLMQVRAPTRQV